MGTWGPGVFDNDTARDHLFDLMQGLADNVAEALAEADFAAQSDADPALVRQTLTTLLDTVLPNVEIICVLHESLTGGFLPDPQTAENWRSLFEHLSRLAAQPEQPLSADRIAVINATFDRLIQFCRGCWDDDQLAA